MAAQDATDKVAGLTEDKEQTRQLEKMHEDARETEERGTRFAVDLEGKKTAVLDKAGETKAEATEIDWAPPIQKNHFEQVKAGSIKLAGQEDPGEAA
jgi:hypothetical protein